VYVLPIKERAGYCIRVNEENTGAKPRKKTCLLEYE